MTSRNTSSMSVSRSSPKVDGGDCKKIEEGEQINQYVAIVTSTIDQLKTQVQANRSMHVKEKIESNAIQLKACTAYLQSLADTRQVPNAIEKDGNKDMFTLRIESAHCKLSDSDHMLGDKENVNCQEEGSSASSTIIYASSSGCKSIVRAIKLPFVERIPPYTTWIFLDRNQRMADDQSVVGRRRIYYDKCGNEALVCSDSEEEVAEEEDDRHEFTEGDDFVLRMTIQEHGQSQAVFTSLGQCIEAKPSELEARYIFLTEQDKKKQVKNSETAAATAENIASSDDIFLGKDLDAALDSFDNLFCRRCLVFDCRLHGCSQGLVLPSEKQSPWSNPEEDNKTPCGIHCYLLALKATENITVADSSTPDACEVMPLRGTRKDIFMECFPKEGSGANSSCTGVKRPTTVMTEGACSGEEVTAESNQGDSNAGKEASTLQHAEVSRRGKRRIKRGGISRKDYKRTAKEVLVSMRKRQKTIAVSDMDTIVSGSTPPSDVNFSSNTRCSDSSKSKISQKKLFRTISVTKRSRKQDLSNIDDDQAHDIKEEDEEGDETRSVNDIQFVSVEKHGKRGTYNKDTKVEISADKHWDNGWSALEKGLYFKGIEIFGKNSCLISRNLLSGLKTCSEVAEYMSRNGSILQYGDLRTLRSDGSGKADCMDTLEIEVRTRSRFWRRRGRVRRLKYTWKSAGHPSIRKRMADGKGQPCKQYTPCGCQLTCGKQCACLRGGTCCEKYCGCSKSCKNRFRGCHCAKSQCRSRQCPCFAAGRECDPDVCRNCWVSCGDGSFGVPPQRGDNYECRNMKLLLKQQQRVLLGKSDVAGWGAFLRNPVNKHDYLGEYTGELISHKEADKRGKIYDREDSSFLFNLNDQFVLDAYRKGDKLKFANHSPNPNCYAKVIMVAGDHRVGIFAKERIAAGEELFYDYRYEPDRAPVWAKKPEGSNSRRDETLASHGRAKKIA
ncbi:histone-lysine N-methyltransferase CLF isoform X2 [Cryptomeria japonica]|uniref:histone-lysine N-methyltransferase CLF isoform X2 n=1 Tax=Cryptomeria japonica TaxID=3369 RepID=UPI0027DA4B87|nr:histone-lysine N-methyltransferase CLF isoform X2 [Cryptomeria japonica]